MSLAPDESGEPRPISSAARIRRFVVVVALLLAATAVLGWIAFERRRDRAEAELANHIRAGQLQDELALRAEEAQTADWTGYDGTSFSILAREAEAFLDAGPFRKYDPDRESLERAVVEAWLQLGEPRRAVPRLERTLERRLEQQRDFGSDGATILMDARVMQFGSKIADLHADLARALLASGDGLRALREALTALEMYEEFEAEDSREIVVFLPGLAPSLEARIQVGEILVALEDPATGELLLGETLADAPERSSFPTARGHAILAASAEKRGDWEVAVNERRAALEAEWRGTNMEDPPFAQLSFELACTLDAGPQAGWDEALALYERTLAARRASACGDFEGLADHLTRLGRCLGKTGDARRARETLAEALAMKRRMFGRDDPRAVEAEREVELVVPEPTLLEAAEATQREAVDAAVMQGGDSPDRVTALNELGRTVRAQGKAREALGYYVQALEMQQRIVPGDSPGAATLMNNVALARGRLGDRTAEKKLLDESLAMRRRLFGGDSGDDDHADIVQSLMNIGSWHHERNEFDRAFEFESQAVAMMRRLSPGDDMDLAVAIDNLGSTACDLGRDDESIALHREALAMERRLVSGDDPDVAQTLDELGVMYYRTDHPREALETLGEALHMRRRLHAGDHADIVTTLSHIGWTQEDLHETRSAIETYREALAMQLRLEPDGVVEVVAMHVHVARLFVELEEFEPARASFTAALVLGQELLPGSLSELAKALKGIGTLCERTRSWADSEAAVLTAGRGVHECKGLAPKARARALASVAAFYQAWNAAEPTAEREKSAAEWAEAR